MVKAVEFVLKMFHNFVAMYGSFINQIKYHVSKEAASKKASDFHRKHAVHDISKTYIYLAKTYREYFTKQKQNL